MDDHTLTQLRRRYPAPWQAGALAARIAEIEAAEADMDAMRSIGTRLAEQAAREALQAAADVRQERRRVAEATLGHDALAIGLLRLLHSSGGRWQGTMAGLVDQLQLDPGTSLIWFGRRLRHQRHHLRRHGLQLVLRHDGERRLVEFCPVDPTVMDMATALAD
jgi:hypothetical protein